MADLRALEFDDLRGAIRARATLAPALVVFAVIGWATLTLWVFTSDVVSAATLVPLIVLAAGFEATVALQTSANRLARYLQAAYEESLTEPPDARPRWESTSLLFRQRFGPIGSNALFPVLFGLATAVNFVPAAVSGTSEELAGIGLAHLLLIVRIVIADRRAGRRQDEDLERYRSLLSSASASKSAPPS
jgi:hypothetical protein